MKYEYRELSNEKSEQLNAMGFKDMYGNECFFDGGEECLTTSDEKIVFALVNYSHEEDFPNWYLLEYNGWYYMIDMFERYLGAESLGKKLDRETLIKYKKKEKPITYFMANDITAIGTGVQGNTEEKEPETEEIVAVLKELIPVWNQYNAGRMNVNDSLVTTEIRYKDEVL